VVDQARAAGLMSDDHFTVDGTLIEAWASLKSFEHKDEQPGDKPPPDDPGNPTVDFHGETSNLYARVEDGSGGGAREEGDWQGGEAVLLEEVGKVLVAPPKRSCQRGNFADTCITRLDPHRRTSV
jgi:hypothetical protein